MTHDIIVAGRSADLRRGFNHIGVGVVMIVHDGTGSILLMKRGPEARDEQGSWAVCGGAVEFGELIEESVLRELREELRIEPLEVSFLTAYDVHREFGGQNSHWIHLVHSVLIDRNTPSLGEPAINTEFGWFDQASLPTPLHSQFDRIMSLAVKADLIR